MLDPITAFLKEKEITYSGLDDDGWLHGSMFLTDVMEHLQTLNLQFQGKYKKKSDLSQCIFSLEKKLQPFQKDIKIKHFVLFLELKKNCSSIKQENSTSISKC